MPTPKELQDKFWSALKSDSTVMLGLAGVDEGHTRPMTAYRDGDSGPLWFFTSTDTSLAKEIAEPRSAMATFTSHGHDLYACIHGRLRVDHNRAMVDRLWNRSVAAWFAQGKDDPKLLLLCFEPHEAEIWEDASSLVAGLKLLLGSDPKTDFRDSVAKVTLA